MRAILASALALTLVAPGDSGRLAATQAHIAVTVADSRGRAVATLTAADFAVTERGVPVPVVSATYVAAEASPSPSPSTPAPDDTGVPDGARVVGIFLDDYHVAPDHTAVVREALTAFLREQLTAADRVLVVRPLDPLLDLSLSGTPNDAQAAVAAFEGRLGLYEPRTSFERELIAGEPARIDRARARIAASAVQAMLTRLARAGERRKALLVVTEGIPPAGPAGRLGDAAPTLEALARVATRANIVVSSFTPVPPAAASAGRTASGGGAGPTGTPSAPAPSVTSAKGDTPGATTGGWLADLVRASDGHLVTLPARDGLQDVVRDLASYYLLTLDGAADGQFHPLSVRVRGGLSVRMPPGYWAITPDELTRLTRAANPDPPRPTLPPVRTSRLIVPWVGQERSRDGRTRVTMVWEPAPARAGERARGLPPSHVVLRALLPDGSAAYEGMVQAASSGLGSLAQATFDVAPGRLRLQMSIEDASARVLDTDVREIVVRPWADALALGTPRVFRARTAREFHQLEADPAAIPAAGRTFSRVERLLMRVPMYAGGESGANAVAVEASLVNRNGQVMRTLPVTRGLPVTDGSATPASLPAQALRTTPATPTIATPTATTDWATIDLPLAGLAAGDYSVQWRARHAGADAIDTVSFRVTP